MRKHLSLFLFLVATCTIPLYAQVSGPPKLPYLLGGISFSMNDNYVRFRTQPNLKSDTITLLNKGTRVIPVATSESKQKIGQRDYFWYKCYVPALNNKVGWIYGEYVSPVLNTHERVVYIVDGNFSGKYNGGWADIHYKFVNGSFERVSKNDIPSIAKIKDMPVFAGEGTKTHQIATVSADRKPQLAPFGNGVETWFQGAHGTLPSGEVVGMLGKQLRLGSYTADPAADAAWKRRTIPLFRSHLRTLERDRHDPSRPLLDYHIVSEDVEHFVIRDAKSGTKLDYSFYDVYAKSEHRIVTLTSFLIEYPDGHHQFTDDDYWGRTYPNGVNDQYGKGYFHYTTHVFAPPAGLPPEIWLHYHGYENFSMDLLLTNGYIVAEVGAFDGGGM